jgi:transposase-like protein
MTRTKKQSTEAAVREIRRKTRRKFAPEEKVWIVLEGLRGEQSISELCRREGIASNLYYRWSKDFLEAGKDREVRDEGPARHVRLTASHLRRSARLHQRPARTRGHRRHVQALRTLVRRC